MNLLTKYFNLKGLYLLITIVLANLILIWLSKTFLINEVAFYNAFSSQLTYERSIQLFDEMKKLSWISYVIAPVILLLKFLIITFVIYTGAFFYNVQTRISLSSIFRIVIASELVFVIGGFIKFLWFYLFAGNYNLNDLGFFYPMSLINFFNKSELSKVWIYPFQTVNLFHIFYILFISYGLNKICSIEKSCSDKIVLSSYIPALVIWVALIIFLTIDVSV
jgi:hypothetical protein